MALKKFSKANKGTYVGVRFDAATLDQVEKLQENLNLFERTPRDKLHATIVFSRVTIPYAVLEEPCNIGKTTKYKVFKTASGKRALVLLIDSDYLRNRHEYGNILGATYDFPNYQPHITLSYDIGSMAIPKDAPVFDVGISHEYMQELDLEWTPKK